MIFIVVVVILVKHTRGMHARKKESMDIRTALRLLISCAGVLSLFGGTWLFAALTITVDEVRQPAQVLFAIFNSLQGFFIFLFFCIFSKEARESWKQVLSCGRYKSPFLNPSLKISKNTGGKSKNQSKIASHNPSSEFTSKNTESFGVTSSNGKGSTGITSEYRSSGKRDQSSGSNIYSEPGLLEGDEKNEYFPSTFSGNKDEGNDSNTYSEPALPGREEKEDLSITFAGREGKNSDSHVYSELESEDMKEHLPSTFTDLKNENHSSNIKFEPKLDAMDLSAGKTTGDGATDELAEMLLELNIDHVENTGPRVLETNIDEGEDDVDITVQQEEDEISLEMGEISIEFADD